MRIALTEAAEADLVAIHSYYAERSADVAKRVLATILNAISGLAHFPLIGRPGEVPGTRERIVRRYPYRIVYHIDETYEIVEIWRVLHSAQGWPSPW